MYWLATLNVLANGCKHTKLMDPQALVSSPWQYVLANGSSLVVPEAFSYATISHVKFTIYLPG